MKKSFEWWLAFAELAHEFAQLDEIDREAAISVAEAVSKGKHGAEVFTRANAVRAAAGRGPVPAWEF